MQVDTLGNTEYSLPIPSNLNTTISYVGGSCTGAVSPSELKMEYIVYNPIKLGNSTSISAAVVIGNRAGPNPIDPGSFKPGDKVASLVYVAQDLNVTGSVTCPEFGDIKVTRTLNAQLKAGWNYLIGHVIQVANNVPIEIQLTSSTALPSDLKWYYFAPNTAP